MSSHISASNRAPFPCGMGVALVTPFSADETIDYDSLGRLVDYQIENGADYLVVLATTSESVTLDCCERRAVADFVIERAAGRVPLVLGMSNNCTRELVRHMAEVDLTGFSAILSVVPYYNKPSQEGIYRHFRAVAQASPLPVILYNVPSRTGRNLEAETTLRLGREFPGKIIGIKEASGNLEQIGRIIDRAPDGFVTLSGDDVLTLRLMQMGAKGVISVIANALPRVFSQVVWGALADPQHPQVIAADEQLQPLMKAVMEECNPSGIKHLLSVMGWCSPHVRLPLVEVSAEVAARIAEAFQFHKIS